LANSGKCFAQAQGEQDHRLIQRKAQRFHCKSLIIRYVRCFPWKPEEVQGHSNPSKGPLLFLT
jgi:hypothetical protein